MPISNPDGPDPYSPEDTARHSPSYRNERDPHGHDRDFNPHRNEYEPSVFDEYQDELAADDDHSGYNWGPPPNPDHIPESRVGAILRQGEQFPMRQDRRASLHDHGCIDDQFTD